MSLWSFAPLLLGIAPVVASVGGIAENSFIPKVVDLLVVSPYGLLIGWGPPVLVLALRLLFVFGLAFHVNHERGFRC